MLSQVILASFIMGFVLGASEPDIDDFDITLQGYEFVFHDYFDLLLIEHGNKCYTMTLPDDAEVHVLDDTMRKQVEASMIALIEHDKSGSYIKTSSLEEMRNTYKDALADFHCMDKQVLKIDITRSEAERILYGETTQASTTAQPTTTQPTTTHPVTGTYDPPQLFEHLFNHRPPHSHHPPRTRHDHRAEPSPPANNRQRIGLVIWDTQRSPNNWTLVV